MKKWRIIKIIFPNYSKERNLFPQKVKFYNSCFSLVYTIGRKDKRMWWKQLLETHLVNLFIQFWHLLGWLRHYFPFNMEVDESKLKTSHDMDMDMDEELLRDGWKIFWHHPYFFFQFKSHTNSTDFFPSGRKNNKRK